MELVHIDIDFDSAAAASVWVPDANRWESLASVIQYRLHPADVGFSLVAEGLPVRIHERVDEVLRVSYQAPGGARRVMAGPRDAVLDRLRSLGYAFVLVAP